MLSVHTHWTMEGNELQRTCKVCAGRVKYCTRKAVMELPATFCEAVLYFGDCSHKGKTWKYFIAQSHIP